MFLSDLYCDETYHGPPPDENTKVLMRRQEINATIDHGVKAIFFDLHGVLVDIAGWHKVALLSAMEDVLGAIPTGLISSRHQMWKIYGGTMAQLLYMKWLGQIPYGVLHEIYDKKQEYTREFIERRCKPIPRIIDVMNYVQSIGLRLACVTNGNRINAEKMIDASGLSKYFEFIITREDVGGKIKPHPRPYLEARYRMKLGHKEALVIDDTSRGILSGVEAFCRTWRLKEQANLNVYNLMRILHSYRCPL